MMPKEDHVICADENDIADSLAHTKPLQKAREGDRPQERVAGARE